MVQFAQNGDLILQALRALDHFFDDKLDGAISVRQFLEFSLVDYSVGASAQRLHRKEGTFGLNS